MPKNNLPINSGVVKYSLPQKIPIAKPTHANRLKGKALKSRLFHGFFFFFNPSNIKLLDARGAAVSISIQQQIIKMSFL